MHRFRLALVCLALPLDRSLVNVHSVLPLLSLSSLSYSTQPQCLALFSPDEARAGLLDLGQLMLDRGRASASSCSAASKRRPAKPRCGHHRRFSARRRRHQCRRCSVALDGSRPAILLAGKSRPGAGHAHVASWPPRQAPRVEVTATSRVEHRFSFR
ncbi:hypothetical protein BDZ90DRAFT_19220 [Jaminaea rosea]|uniref:Secreted protein n=1 Tax=Jaminaea rosea TaxID=1569628 RepID=A0A316V242_9BASI|nr:hypothetical protein BDZ90DRAFT_19220 [Jaminaea rosea]PWN30631.1 hypothetical protein BDZ90DRAFT_19220 [Jaminaea rosea]